MGSAAHDITDLEYTLKPSMRIHWFGEKRRGIHDHRSSFIVLPAEKHPTRSYSSHPLGIVANLCIADNDGADHLTDARKHRECKIARAVQDGSADRTSNQSSVFAVSGYEDK